MVWQVFVVLGRDLPDLAQIPPRAGGEVVMLEVVAEVDVGDVPPADVVVGLLALDELVVLGDDVDGGGVRTDGAESGDEDEEKGVSSPEVIDEVVGEEDEDVVDDFVDPDAGVMHEDRSEGIEDFDDGVEDVFVPLLVVRELGFPGKGQVGVGLQLIQEVVVVGVVAAEGDGAGQSHGDVAEHGHEFIEGHVAASAVVREVVDAAVEGVVEESSDEVGVEQDEPYIKILHFLMVTLDQ